MFFFIYWLGELGWGKKNFKQILNNQKKLKLFPFSKFLKRSNKKLEI